VKIITTKEKIPTTWKKSIFLAGPTSRNNGDNITEWRKEVCNILKKRNYDGVVFIPEPYIKEDYDKQVAWENECLNMADCILFWVPRSIDLPGFTTNVEYGDWMKSGKVVFGSPNGALKVRYLKYKAKQYFIPVRTDLEHTVEEALKYIGEGDIREDGERYVPIQVWRTKQFHSWYDSVKNAGNVLEGAKVEWSFRVGKNKEKLFCWIMHVNVYITEEKRNKVNEFILARTDITSVVAYKLAANIIDTEILLIKEFRSPCSNNNGFIYELPSGSSKDDTKNMDDVVIDELREETGLDVNKDRFNILKSRQVAATLSTHKAFLYSLELSEEEIKKLKDTKREYGQENDTERTYVLVKTLKQILSDNLLDYANLGMIFQALTYKESKDSGTSDWVGNFLRS
jgi:8-oxo-dGTP pyrophosphatase MutT (NUDIX family)